LNFVSDQYPPGSSFSIDIVDNWSGFVHGFGDRTLDVPIAEGAKVWSSLGGGQTELLLLNQEHGKRVVKITEPLTEAELASFKESPPAADAWIVSLDVLTSQKLVCGIRTADCYPVIIASRTTPFVAAIHCGWRGAQAGLVVDILTQLARLGAAQRECEMVIGPGASSLAYEIQDDVASKLNAAFEFVNFPTSTEVESPVIERDGKKYGALANLLQAQAIFSGVKKDRILVHPSCTISSSRYFSHRREKELAGRQLTFIGPKLG